MIVATLSRWLSVKMACKLVYMASGTSKVGVAISARDGSVNLLGKNLLEGLDRQSKPYDDNGDLLASDGMKFRRVGWRINGGDYDKMMVTDEGLQQFHAGGMPHGGYSPVYVEVGE